jgi:hypothetical protein
MELFAMATGALLMGGCIWLLKIVRDINAIEERLEDALEEVRNVRDLVDLTDGVVDTKAQEYERNWQMGVTNILGYDMSDARKAVSDE